MKNLLTIQIIIKNNESTIRNTLESLMPLNANILVVDIGSKDKTVSICKEYNADVIKLSFDNDFSKIRNQMIALSKTDWLLYLDPCEIIMNGHQNIINCLAMNRGVFKLSIIKEDVITKQNRLWNKKENKKFINPVFEFLQSDSKELDSYIISGNPDLQTIYAAVDNWKHNKPLDLNPIYYSACCNLFKKNWDSFLNEAERYIYLEKNNSQSFYMINYYKAMVLTYIKKDYQSAIKSLILCIAHKQNMAEFWCLLGDIFYAIKDYEKAIAFYENAIALGSYRRKDDDWLMEISKYKKYPENMIESCNKILNSTNFYA